MPVSSINSKGNLTNTVVVLRTAASLSEHIILKLNSTDAANRTVTLYQTGNAATDVWTTILLKQGWTAIVRVRLGSGQDIRAKIDSGTSVNWFIDEDTLT